MAAEFQTRDQKLNTLRVEFVNIAGNEDGEVSWDSCEQLIKRHYPDVSSTRVEQLLSDADEDGIEKIKFENFMVIVRELSNGTNVHNSSMDIDETVIYGNMSDLLKLINTIVNQTGYISKGSIKELFQQYKIPFQE